MIVLLCLCALLSVLWLHAEVGWCDERADKEALERQVARLRYRKQLLAEALWADCPRDRLTRYVAKSESEAIDALIADSLSSYR